MKKTDITILGIFSIIGLITGSILVTAGADINILLIILLGEIVDVISVYGIYKVWNNCINLKYKKSDKIEKIKNNGYLVIGIFIAITGIIVCKIGIDSSIYAAGVTLFIISAYSIYQYLRLKCKEIIKNEVNGVVIFTIVTWIYMLIIVFIFPIENMVENFDAIISMSIICLGNALIVEVDESDKQEKLKAMRLRENEETQKKLEQDRTKIAQLEEQKRMKRERQEKIEQEQEKIKREKQERIEKTQLEELERIQLEKIELEKESTFYKECSEKKLLDTESDENKEKILEIAEKNELKCNIIQLVNQMYYIEKTKDLMFDNYTFIRPLKEIIEKEGIYPFVCLIKKLDWNKNIEEIDDKMANFFEILLDKKKSTKINPQKLLNCLVYYSKRLNVIENDEELNTISHNLLKTYINNKYIDYSYISNKIYDIYQNSYKEKYKINITKKDFSNIFNLMKIKKSEKGKYSDFYELITKEYKTAKDFPPKVYDELVFHKRGIEFYKDIGYRYIADKKSEYSFYEICALLLDMDAMWDNYSMMVYKEKVKIENRNQKEKEQKAKEKLEKERLRLLKGDISKETKLNKTIQQKKIKQKEIELGYKNVKDGYEFEEYIADLYSKLGYSTNVTRKSGDQGADIIAKKNDKKYVIQTKFYSTPVSNKAVQEIVAALAMYKADYGIVVTNNTYTTSAIELAKANNIELIDGNKIEEYKKQILSKL